MAANKKVILGFTGLIASGKGTAAEYLKSNYQASHYRFSTMLRDMAKRIYIPETRDNLVKLSEILRATFGEDVLAKTMAQDVKNDKNKVIVVEGIRRLADIAYLAKMPNFVLVEIFADPKIRHARLVKRGENTDDTSKTYEQFLADHQRSTELSILDVIKHAKEKIDNNDNLKNLHKQLDALLKKYVG
ncbi:MAG: AAA family ATPase [Patescibacteria group bacterium]